MIDLKRSFTLALLLAFTVALLMIAARGLVLPRSVQAQAGAGIIAYIRPNDTTGDQIRFIAPNGSGDRLIWQTGQADPGQLKAIHSLAWRKDASELAFDSNHEAYCSFYDTDIFAIHSDGSGYRRITQSPACAELAHYPTGTVHVPVRNFSSGPVFPYVQGAPDIQMVTGSSETVTFENVADFGEGQMQAVVVISGGGRWLDAAVLVDVVAGGEVTTPVFTVSGTAHPEFGARGPSWHREGDKLAYTLGFGQMRQISANPPSLASGVPLLQEGTDTPLFATHIEWGPTPATSDQFLYAGGGDFGQPTTIYLASAGSNQVGQQLVSFETYDLVLGLDWLPDASGFVYAVTEEFLHQSNVYSYDFDTQQSTRLTEFANEYAVMLTVAPDGEQIVFEHGVSESGYPSGLDRLDLWIMNRDGSEQRLFLENARAPAWSPGEPTVPNPTPSPTPPSGAQNPLFLPEILKD